MQSSQKTKLRVALIALAICTGIALAVENEGVGKGTVKVIALPGEESFPPLPPIVQGAEVAVEGDWVKVIIKSPTTREVGWSVKFKE